MPTTPNLGLPLVNAGQSNPHIPINQALNILDAAVVGGGGGGPPFFDCGLITDAPTNTFDGGTLT